MEKGYYIIKYNNNILPARWDGSVFNHEKGICTELESEVLPYTKLDKIRKKLKLKVRPIPLGCPVGCNCTTNSDGSVTVHCSTQ